MRDPLHDECGPGGFGVRRPLRFLAYKLDLTNDQVAELARILNELKTERAQAAVDDRRVVSSLADLLEAPSFDTAGASQATAARVEAAERLRGAVVRALTALHGLLTFEQRARLAYLIRTGTLVL